MHVKQCWNIFLCFPQSSTAMFAEADTNISQHTEAGTMMADVWHTFSIHFLDMKLTKICSFAELVIKLFADWLGYVTIIYYHTNITVASHVHKITGNLTICSIVCSVKLIKKKNYAVLVFFFRQTHRLSPAALTKGQQSGERSMILQPARAFSTLFSIFWLHLTISYNRKQHDLKVDTPQSF